MSFELDDTEWRKDLLNYINKHMPNEIEKKLCELANDFLETVKPLTPVNKKPGGGTLRGNWHISAVAREGNSYFIEVYNNTEYAAHVEYGHRILNKKGNEIGYVPSVFFMTTTLEELKRDLPGELQAWLDDMVRMLGR